MNTSVGRGVKVRPDAILSLPCIRSFRCRISSSGVIFRIGGGAAALAAGSTMCEGRCGAERMAFKRLWKFRAWFEEKVEIRRYDWLKKEPIAW
jgi:hypothetical protein